MADLVDGILRLLFSDVADPVNLGNPREMTILEFARLVLRFTGSSSRIEFGALPVDDPKVRQPDIERARRLLGWEPRVAVEEGLPPTIDYFRNALARESGPEDPGRPDEHVGV